MIGGNHVRVNIYCIVGPNYMFVVTGSQVDILCVCQSIADFGLINIYWVQRPLSKRLTFGSRVCGNVSLTIELL